MYTPVMKRWNHLVESRGGDVDLRALARKVHTADLEAKIDYLVAVNRRGETPNLTIFNRDADIGKLVAYLWKTKSFDIIFNDNYPFGYPGQPNATAGVRFLAGALRLVHVSRFVSGVRLSTFFKYVQKWLSKHRQANSFGRSMGNTPLESFIRNGEEDAGMTINGDGWAGLHEGLWFPTPNEAESYGFHYGELVRIGSHINGGAIYMQSGDGVVRELELFTTPEARDRMWAEWEAEADDQIAQAEADEDEYLFPRDHPYDEMDNPTPRGYDY